MQLQATQTRPAGVLANPAPGRPAPPLHALVVSSELEVRKQLIRMLEALLVDVIVCSSGTQAAEVLSQQPFEIVYCDEHLADGMYSDLIRPTHSEGQYREW